MRFILPLVLALSFLSGCSRVPLLTDTHNGLCLDNIWAHERSIIEPDPAVIYGRLENGFRYAVMENSYPENRVFMYLRVGAGSVQEKDRQKGAAHFLEHMMFNGTRHFPSGQLVEQLQQIGVEFGRDLNAHTSYEETAYFINLPSGSEEEIDKGLQVLGDYAAGALLTAEDFEQERGVILAEKRSRDSVGQRIYKAGSDFTFKGTRFPDRWVIGDEETLKAMTVDDLRDYYDTWYRPDNMVLVVVGNIDSQGLKEKIENQFSSFIARTPAPQCISLGHPQQDEHYPATLYYPDQESESVDLSLETIREITPVVDGEKRKRQELAYHLLNVMMNARLQKIVEGDANILSSANFYSVEAYNRYHLNMLSTKVSPKQWQDSLHELLQILLSVRKYGFGDKELLAAKKSVEADLRSSIQTENSRESRELAESLLEHISGNEVFLSPGQEMEIYSPLLEQLGLEELNALFQSEWQLNRLKIQVMGKLDPADEKEVKTLFFDAVHQEVERPDLKGGSTFPYLSLPAGKAGTYSSEVQSEIGVEHIQFGSGLPLYLKKTGFQQAEVAISITFGQGRNKAEVPGLAMLAESTVNSSGTGRMSQGELEQQLAGYSIGSNFSVDDQNCTLTGTSTVDDLEHLFELLYAKLFDPSVRKKAFDNQKQKMLRMARTLQTTPQGLYRTKGQRFLASGDKRFGMADEEEVMSISYDMVADWYKQELADGLIDIAVVGDFDRQQVVELTEKYFGTAKVSTEQFQGVEGVLFPAGKTFEHTINSDVEKALVVMGWPVSVEWNIDTARQLNVLTALLEEKVRSVLREKLGAVYSPSVYAVYPRWFKEYGYIALSMVVDPKRVNEVVREVELLTDELAGEKIEPELAGRILNPLGSMINERVKTNDYWLYTVLSLASRYPDQLGFASSLTKAYTGMDITEVQNLASEIFAQKKATVKILAKKSQ